MIRLAHNKRPLINDDSHPEGPGTSLLRNWGLKTMIVVAFGAEVLNN